MTTLTTEAPRLGLDGLLDIEVDFVAEVETAMEALGLRVVSVYSKSDEPLRITVEDDAGTRARLVSLDEVWGFAKDNHTTCQGRGYRVLRQPDGSRPKRTFPYRVNGGVNGGFEYRTGCACASSGFLREHPGVVVFGQSDGQAYAHWPVEGGGELLIKQPAAAPEPDAPVRSKMTPGEKAIKRAAELRAEADEVVDKARALDAEIAELEGPMARTTAEIKDAIALHRYELTEQDGHLRDGEERVRSAEDAVAEALKALESAKAGLRDVQEVTRDRAAVIRKRCAVLIEHITAQQTKLDAIEVPPRLRRLRKEQRILRDKAEALRERAERVAQRR